MDGRFDPHFAALLAGTEEWPQDAGLGLWGSVALAAVLVLGLAGWAVVLA